MFNITDIKKIEMSITGSCNAGCPLCARHITGTSIVRKNINTGHLPLDHFYKFVDELGDNTKNIYNTFCGTIGDPLVHPNFSEMWQKSCESFRRTNVDTNASVRTTDYWTELGLISKHYKNCAITFSIDGLKDTNHIYRVFTDFDKIIDNAQAFIKAGGKAEWKFLVFEHNQHQVEEAKALSKKLGFDNFIEQTSIRFSLKNLERTEKLIEEGTIKGSKRSTDKFKKINQIKSADSVGINETVERASLKNIESINCKSISQGMLFLSHDSKVHPCCYFDAGKQTQEKQYTDYESNVIKLFGENYNSIVNYSVKDILTNHYLANYLPNSFEMLDNTLCDVCVKTCGVKNKETYWGITNRKQKLEVNV